MHTDTLNEAGFVESTIAAVGGRTIHAYHTEGAGGGHAPDIITVAGEANFLPSSTNPTRPHTVNTIDEHLDMLMVCHHLNPAVPEDLVLRREPHPPLDHRGRGPAPRHGRHFHDRLATPRPWAERARWCCGPGRRRMSDKRRWGSLPGDGPADNCRARRYVAKYTICPAVAHGLDAEVGSVAVGKLADLVLYDPAFFGVRPSLVIKGGLIAWAQMGDANASIPTPQPVRARPMFGASPAVAAQSSLAFVAPAAIEDGLAERLEAKRQLVAVRGTASADQG